MIDQVSQICYMFLAPVSVISELLLIFAFWKLRYFKKHPEIMIFWQSVSQIILDLHWVTGLKTIKSYITDDKCLLIGAFSVYFYYLSWDYILFLSIEILLKILKPHKTEYKKRRIWYHSLAHLSSLSVFIVLATSNTNGTSYIKTCFIQKRTIYELIIIIPAFFHFPLSIGIILYTLIITHNTYVLPYLKYHMLVVVTFSLTWVPIAIVHSFIYFGLTEDIQEDFLYVNFKQVSILLGASSGFFVFLSRIQQKGVLKKIFAAIFKKNPLKVTNK